jgi:hypothetical protein
MNFSAADIARAAGRTRQSVNRLLAGIPPSTQMVVKGQPVPVWSLESLPSSLRSDLDAAAKLQGFGDAFRLLSAPREAWQPAFPLSEASQPAIDKAVKLRAALALALSQKDDTTISPADFERAGIAAYQKQFGHPIGPRHWRRLFQRTLDRARSAPDFTRLELYLDDNFTPSRLKCGRPDQAGLPFLACHQEELGDTIKTLDNPLAPTAKDRQFLFDAAFRHLENHRAVEQTGAPAFKRTLIDFLFNAAPALSKSRPAFERVFNSKLAAWTLAGGIPDALTDRRALASGNKRHPDFTEDKNKIRDLAILHDGNISLAHRKLWESGQLSQAFVNYYQFDPRKNKSYLPHSIRREITQEVKMCGPIHRGPWKAKMRGPYIPRDWKDVNPGDWFSGDDVTWNSYFYFYDEGGVLHIERGECLMLHDLRTGYLLDYVLIAGKYNSRHIRSLILAVHDKHGLPHAGFYFERGVWKAGIIEDLAAKENNHSNWRETESGLATFNLQIRHATTPRAKTIEGLIRILQERQRSEPGFVGFDERRQEVERMQDFIARARAGKVDPPEKLLEMAQWTKRLDQIFEDFNADVQNGKMLAGASPVEAWQTGLDKKPLRKLPDDARYLLSTHCKPVKVRQEGILLNCGKTRMLFCNDQTGPLVGQEVLAYYNLESPELLTVSDMNRQNYFTVKAVSLPAMSATKDQFAVAHAQISGHQKAARSIYGSIQHPRASTITRDAAVSEITSELGRFHGAETQRFQEEQTATKRTLRKIQVASAGRAVPIGQNIRNPDRVLEGIQIENDWREENQPDQQNIPVPANAGESQGAKTYVLDPSPVAAPSVGQFWRLWVQVERITKNKNLRHALTAKHLGSHPKPQDMTPEQLAKMLAVFLAIIRDSRKAAQ